MPRQASTAGVRERMQEQALVPVGASTALTDEVREMQPQFEMALADSGISPERFVRIGLTLFRRTPKLYQCSRPTVLGALLTAAQLGLDLTPGLDHAYLIPRDDHKNNVTNCQLLIGYKGYIDLARRSGDIKDIDATEVYEGDDFRYWRDENGSHLHHVEWAAQKPSERTGPRGAIWVYYGLVVYRGGGNHINVMALEDIEERRKRSASERAGRGSPWTTDYVAMCRKTTIRAMVPFLPLTTSVAERLSRDEGIVTYKGGQDVEVSFLEPGNMDALDQTTGEPTLGGRDGEPPAGDSEEREHIDVTSTEAEPPRDPTEPPPSDPTEPATRTTPDIVTDTQAKVGAWSDDQVRELLANFGQSTAGSAKQRRDRFLAFAILKRHADTRAVEDLF